MRWRAQCARRSPSTGDILAFLPGMGEIRRTEAALAGCGATVLPLHGDLPAARAGSRAAPGRGAAGGARNLDRRNLAHRARRADRHRWRLASGAAARPRERAHPVGDAAHQPRRRRTARRTGRARGAGVAIRLWSEALHRGLAAYDRPEILEAELSSLLLDCAAWGAQPADLPFQDQPPAGALAAAAALLGNSGRWTRRAASPRPDAGWRSSGRIRGCAAMMLAAETRAEAALAADLAALLEERDPLRAPDAPAESALRLGAIAEGHRRPIAARCPASVDAAGQYRRRLRTARAGRAAGDPGQAGRGGVPGPHRPASWRAGNRSAFRGAAARGCRSRTRSPRLRCWRSRRWN